MDWVFSSLRVSLLLLWAVAYSGCAQIGEAFPDAEVQQAVEPGQDSSAVVDTGGAESDLAGTVDTSPDDNDSGPTPELPPAEDIPADVPVADDEGPDAAGVDEPCTPCETADDCPPDIECSEYGADGAFCGPACVAFACPPEAEGITTSCYQDNAFGTCTGSRGCFDGELLGCSALEPSPEVCNGADDDCDGTVDEDAPDFDGDGQADCVDDDDDDDTVLDIADNCPFVKNPMQLDLDQDGLGDSCDNDIDGDGVANLADCAPLDPDVNTQSVEICNGKDDDCDGDTDEADALGCSFYYPDGDLDGYGAVGLGKCLCGPQAPFTTVDDSDCDDTSNTTHPFADELCDSVDNDCDMTIDEENASGCKAWYFDNDTDGFHVEGASAKCLCFANQANKFTGHSEGDCNDGNPFIYPGAIEVCNAADDSCEGNIDEGCDDDLDGFCDATLEYTASGGITCSFGHGDCDDNDPNAHPGALELCDGKDTNCLAIDDKAEGTVEACGLDCLPCPPPPPGAIYECQGVGPDTIGCQLTCPVGNFCDDCSCDGSTIYDYGSSVVDSHVIYDQNLDTFRIGYYKSGQLRLKAIGPTGIQGNDVIAVPNVSKWTDWGLTMHGATGQFAFAWTAYPDSSIRIGVAGQAGTNEANYVVVPDLEGGSKVRQNVQIEYHHNSQTFMVLWDETTSLGLDIRGVVLDANFAPMSAPFQVVGGAGDQLGASLAARGGKKGFVFSYGTQVGDVTPPGIRFMDQNASNPLSYGLSPLGKAGTSPRIYYDGTAERGLIQWLGADDKYKLRLFGEAGVIGPEVPLGSPAGTAVAANKDGQMRVFYVSAGLVRMKSVDMATGDLGNTSITVSQQAPTQKIVGAVAHPTGYALALWNVNAQLRGRLVAPTQ